MSEHLVVVEHYWNHISRYVCIYAYERTATARAKMMPTVRNGVTLRRPRARARTHRIERARGRRTTRDPRAWTLGARHVDARFDIASPRVGVSARRARARSRVSNARHVILVIVIGPTRASSSTSRARLLRIRLRDRGILRARERAKRGDRVGDASRDGVLSVSYTHLTLPTIYSV